jgi:hypothetical protein
MDRIEFHIDHLHAMPLKELLEWSQRVNHSVFVVKMIKLVLLENFLEVDALGHEERVIGHDAA